MEEDVPPLWDTLPTCEEINNMMNEGSTRLPTNGRKDRKVLAEKRRQKTATSQGNDANKSPDSNSSEVCRSAQNLYSTAGNAVAKQQMHVLDKMDAFILEQTVQTDATDEPSTNSKVTTTSGAEVNLPSALLQIPERRFCSGHVVPESLARVLASEHEQQTSAQKDSALQQWVARGNLTDLKPDMPAAEEPWAQYVENGEKSSGSMEGARIYEHVLSRATSKTKYLDRSSQRKGKKVEEGKHGTDKSGALYPETSTELTSQRGGRVKFAENACAVANSPGASSIQADEEVEARYPAERKSQNATRSQEEGLGAYISEEDNASDRSSGNESVDTEEPLCMNAHGNSGGCVSHATMSGSRIMINGPVIQTLRADSVAFSGFGTLPFAKACMIADEVKESKNKD